MNLPCTSRKGTAKIILFFITAKFFSFFFILHFLISSCALRIFQSYKLFTYFVRDWFARQSVSGKLPTALNITFQSQPAIPLLCMENYKLTEPRYEAMKYRRCGKSGLLLPEISLGFWHNFGAEADFEVCRSIVKYAFDQGITYFDLANNYGPPYGSAETLFGEIYSTMLKQHRDEIIISTKAGHDMWPGPYGEWGSRKNLIASLDRSLQRMQLEYVDIFYSHRPDPVTPLEETMQALVDIVHQGKALYVGISKYPVDKQIQAYEYLQNHGVHCLISQYRYNMFDREVEKGNLEIADRYGSGVIAFSPLAQGLLTNKYLKGIPEN